MAMKATCIGLRTDSEAILRITTPKGIVEINEHFVVVAATYKFKRDYQLHPLEIPGIDVYAYTIFDRVIIKGGLRTIRRIDYTDFYGDPRYWKYIV
jgi:hypothetical protein